MFRYIYIYYGYLENIELHRNQTLTNNDAEQIEYRQDIKIMELFRLHSLLTPIPVSGQ